MRMLDVSGEEAVMVGDHPIDIEAGKGIRIAGDLQEAQSSGSTSVGHIKRNLKDEMVF